MKLGEIITRVQRQFGDDVESQITTADIVRWVNDSCLEIASANATNQGLLKGFTPVVAGQAEYLLPPDLLLLRSVRVNGLKMTYMTMEQLEELDGFSESAVGDPNYYYTFNGKLYLYPCPASALGTVDVYYVKSPDILTDLMLTMEPDVPKQYHPRIVEYCIAQAAELDDNLGHYQIKMQQFKDNVTALRSNSENPEEDGAYPYITYVGEY